MSTTPAVSTWMSWSRLYHAVPKVHSSIVSVAMVTVHSASLNLTKLSSSVELHEPCAVYRDGVSDRSVGWCDRGDAGSSRQQVGEPTV